MCGCFVEDVWERKKPGHCIGGDSSTKGNSILLGIHCKAKLHGQHSCGYFHLCKTLFSTTSVNMETSFARFLIIIYRHKTKMVQILTLKGSPHTTTHYHTHWQPLLPTTHTQTPTYHLHRQGLKASQRERAMSHVFKCFEVLSLSLNYTPCGLTMF